MDTLTQANPSVTKTVAANTSGSIATAGTFAGASVLVEYGIDGTWAPYGRFFGPFAKGILFVSDSLRVTLENATASSSVKLEVTAPAPEGDPE